MKNMYITRNVNFRIFLAIIVGLCLLSCRKSTTKRTPEFFYKDAKVIELCKAIQANDETKIDALLKEGVDINAIGKDGMSPLLWALSFNDKDTFEMILKKGGNPNIRLDKGNGASVMIFVSKMPKNDFLKLALKYGGDPNFGDKSFKTPLFHVISSDEGSLEKVKILVEAGADVNHQNLIDMTPASHAAMINQYHIVYYLFENNADFTLKDNANDTIILTIQNSHLAMDRKSKQYDNLLQCVKFIESKGTKVDFPRKPKGNFKPLPKDWIEVRRKLEAEREQKRFEQLRKSGSKIKPTIDTSEVLKKK